MARSSEATGIAGIHKDTGQEGKRVQWSVVIWQWENRLVRSPIVLEVQETFKWKFYMLSHAVNHCVQEIFVDQLQVDL